MPEQNNVLSEVISKASFAGDYSVRERGHGLEPQYIAKKPSVLRTLNLKTSFLPNLFDRSGRMIAAPVGNMAGETIPLDAAVIAASRVSQAGAHIIIRDNQLNPIPVGETGDIMLADVTAKFSTIEPATYADVADDAEVAVTATLPIHRATLDWSTSQSVAVRFTVPHSAQKNHKQEDLSAELLIALTLGLGRAADRLLISAINATTPSAFTLAAAAAQGLKVSELNGLIGTNATGAVFRDDGSLSVAGVNAELTGDMAGTLIGAWNRAAVAIGQDVRLLAERTNRNGTLDVTAWAYMIPLLPDATKFWSVSA